MRPVWDDAPWAPLPALDGDVTADVCVVGLGGSGLAAVGEALRLGASVVGIDAASVAAGAAGRNGGFLLAGGAPFHHDLRARVGVDAAAALYRATVDELDRMTAETPDAVRRVGSIRLATTEEETADCRRHLAALESDDLPGEWYEGALGVGVRIPTDGAFQPMRRCRALAAAAVTAGATLHESTPALRIDCAEVVTPGGRIHAGVVVVAVDGGLEDLVPEVAGRVRSTRLQMLATAPTDEVEIPCPVYARWGYDYWQQLPTGEVVLGGCRDLFADDEWGAPAEPSADVQRALDVVLADVVGVRAAPVTHRWAGVVGYTADGLPVVDEIRAGVWAVGGYSGTGNVVGAVAGRGAVRLALEGDGTLVAPLRPTVTSWSATPPG